MDALESAVERLLAIVPGGFTNKHLVEATGLKKQTVAARLKRFVRFGYLRKEGRGRGARYLRAQPKNPAMADPGRFWEWLVAEVPRIAHVRLGKIARTFLRGDDVFAVLEAHRNRAYVVLDFDGVDVISEDFADELFCAWPRAYYFHPVAINMTPAISALVEFVRARDREG